MSEMDVSGDGVTDDLEDEELALEAPEADAVEQHQSLRDERRYRLSHIPFDADPADAADQARSVELDEDEYR